MKKIPRKLRNYRRFVLLEAQFFRNLKDDEALGGLAACAPAYEQLATLDRRQLRRLRREGGAWL